MNNKMPPAVGEFAVEDRQRLLDIISSLEHANASQAAAIREAQHTRDSTELRSLCAARDQYRDLSIKYGDKLNEVLKERDAALQLLAKCQEHLHPHRDAVLWGAVFEASRCAPTK